MKKTIYPTLLLLAISFTALLTACDKKENGNEGRTVKVYGLDIYNGCYGCITIYEGDAIVGGNIITDTYNGGTYLKDIHKIEDGKLVLGLYDEYPKKNWTKRGTYQVRFTVGSNEYGNVLKSYKSGNILFNKASTSINLSELEEE